MLARVGIREGGRELVGKCPPPDIAAARKSLYFWIKAGNTWSMSKGSPVPENKGSLRWFVHHTSDTNVCTQDKFFGGTKEQECKKEKKKKNGHGKRNLDVKVMCILNTRGQQPSLVLHTNFWTLSLVAWHTSYSLTWRGPTVPTRVQTSREWSCSDLQNFSLLLWHIRLYKW